VTSLVFEEPLNIGVPESCSGVGKSEYLRNLSYIPRVYVIAPELERFSAGGNLMKRGIFAMVVCCLPFCPLVNVGARGCLRLELGAELCLEAESCNDYSKLTRREVSHGEFKALWVTLGRT
jgi:hypothetical protein